MNTVRADFRQKVDQVKQYMIFRKVGKNLEQRVITWFDYLWLQKQVVNEEFILGFFFSSFSNLFKNERYRFIFLDTLPQKLRVEIGVHVHLAALKRVPIFAEAQAGLLIELITRLKLQIFSPGEYVCKKGINSIVLRTKNKTNERNFSGDIGKEMYIIKRGRLSVVSDDGSKVFVNLEEGSVFGEISILNIPGMRTNKKKRKISFDFDMICRK